MGTHWEQRKIEKKSFPPPKKWMLSLSIGCMKFLFPKLCVTIFGLGYDPHYKRGVLLGHNRLNIMFPSGSHHVPMRVENLWEPFVSSGR
jgi:hypothetical protein